MCKGEESVEHEKGRAPRGCIDRSKKFDKFRRSPYRLDDARQDENTEHTEDHLPENTGGFARNLGDEAAD